MGLAKGDKVVCTDNRGIEPAFPTGQTFEVMEAANIFGHEYVMVVSAWMCDTWVRSSRFEKKENT